MVESFRKIILSSHFILKKKHYLVWKFKEYQDLAESTKKSSEELGYRSVNIHKKPNSLNLTMCANFISKIPLTYFEWKEI